MDYLEGERYGVYVLGRKWNIINWPCDYMYGGKALQGRSSEQER